MAESYSYLRRRSEIALYFDRTAAEAWSRLTSDAPLGRIRRTVRAGREQMRDTLLGWLPPDLTGTRVLDAGCGTGALAVAAARRGARVTAVDLSPTLVELARERLPRDLGPGRVDFAVGDMAGDDLGRQPGEDADGSPVRFDYAVAMDSLIHYGPRDAVATLARIAARTERAIVLTFAPRGPALVAMHAVGRLFPRGDRAPAIEPVAEGALRRALAAEPALADWRPGRTRRVKSGFYTSQALELVRA